MSDYLTLRHQVGAVRVGRDVIRASGPEAASFLEGQLSQHLDGLAVDASTWALLLEPQGKVDAWLRVTRVGDDAFLLDVDGGFGEAVVTRLNRFKLRTKCELEPLEWSCVAVRGPDAPALPEVGAVRYPIAWPGLPGFDLLGETVEPPAEVAACGLDAYEVVRIEAGVPKMGAELTAATIPHEAGQWLIDSSVSFTKGCYTGQELVARIDSRGARVPRHLRGVVVAADQPPPVGAELRHDDKGDKSVGALTSVASSPGREGVVALAFVSRAVEPPADVRVVWEDGDAPARVETLPLVAS